MLNLLTHIPNILRFYLLSLLTTPNSLVVLEYLACCRFRLLSKFQQFFIYTY
ncbi:hypothetical protein MtrunA17_Chr8g0361051 [Medicago truncatula]|uniref:Transmembrane protein n=1 Tax=Medicago truncatula TaxID=3880 RepID=A0A396GKC8_MEDTR|nr:hypothetical protein MtrunA17_Chr8g0361051 [Medicago truncatula]